MRRFIRLFICRENPIRLAISLFRDPLRFSQHIENGDLYDFEFSCVKIWNGRERNLRLFGIFPDSSKQGLRNEEKKRVVWFLMTETEHLKHKVF